MTESATGRAAPAGHPHSLSRSAAASGRGRLVVVFAMVSAFLIVEVIGGLLTNSLALLADDGHMFTDAAGIGLALLAIWFAQRPATTEKSFGYYRVEIFAAVANAMILFAVAGFILYEAARRFAAPPEGIGLPMLGIAAGGLAVNLVSLRLLRAGAATSLNLRGAYLEVLGDLLGSLAVLVAGLVIILTDWTPIDPIASVVIAGLILPRTWGVLREAVDVLLQATPHNIDPEEVRRHLLQAEDV